MITMKKLTNILVITSVILLTVFSSENIYCQEVFPNRPITLISPTGPGMQDTMARILAKVAEKELGQPIIVESKPGAAGTIGVNYVLKAKRDGYTIGSIVTSAYNIIPHMRKVPYNPFYDSIDITTIYKYNFGLAVRTDAPWNSYEELITYARNNPGKVTYSTAGVGRPQHICMEQIAMKEKIKLVHVPFNSGGESVTACLGGHTDVTSQGSADLIPHIKAGKLKLLLTLDDKRWSALPDVPNILEKYDFCAMSYGSIFAPRGVPEPVISKLEAAIEKAKKDSSYIEMLAKSQVDVATLTGKQYSELWRAKYDEMGKVIQTLGIKE
ncbi:tripartite tricarboxylate transporter substrate binding protein [bacterium]|nr:MAG: tripartite tricarboxylate transporter substrate binding protein [bacterium]